LIISKIIAIVATRCHILKQKCTKLDFCWVFTTDPAGGPHSAPPDPLAGLRGSTSKEKEWMEGEREGKESGGEGGTSATNLQFSGGGWRLRWLAH